MLMRMAGVYTTLFSNSNLIATKRHVHLKPGRVQNSYAPAEQRRALIFQISCQLQFYVGASSHYYSHSRFTALETRSQDVF